MIERIYFLKKGGIENDGGNIFFETGCVYAITSKCVYASNNFMSTIEKKCDTRVFAIDVGFPRGQH